jgi:hypothetical protein
MWSVAAGIHQFVSGGQSECIFVWSRLRYTSGCQDIAMEVMRHRIILTYEAEAEETTSDDVVRKVLESVPVP